MKRRAFLASAAAVASGGCLGQITDDPRYVLSAKTVERTESALVPEVSVVDEEVTEESPAAIEVTVHNRSLRVVEVGAVRHPSNRVETLLLYDPVSEDGRMGLDGRSDVTLDGTGGSPCWRTESMARAEMGLPLNPPIPPVLNRSETLGVGATPGADPLEPGSYQFSQRYEQQKVADVNWAFELLLTEPGV